MRYLLFALTLLLIPTSLLAQQQYTDGACILLQQQIDRFSQQRQNSNYRSAKREYDRFCQKPVQAVPRGSQAQQAVPVNTPVAERTEKVPPQPVPVNVVAPQQAVPTITATATETAASDADTIKPPATTSAETSAAEVSREPVLTQPATDIKAEPEQVEAEPETATAEPAIPAAEPVTLPLALHETPPAQQQDLLIMLLNSIPLIAANIVALLLVIFLLTSWLGYNLPGFKGVFAEYKLNQLLRWRLSKQYLHFRKLKLFTAKDELTEIDHLVLCPYGIFVIAVRSDRGRIGGSETAANWSRHYFGATKQLMNPLHQNFKNVEAVKHLLQLQGTDTVQAVHSVIAFNRVAQFASSMPANVMFVDATAAYIKQFTDVVLTEEQVSRFAAVLKQASTA